MTTLVNPSPTLDLSDSIRQLHRRLEVLATRARTTVRLLEVSRHV